MALRCLTITSLILLALTGCYQGADIKFTIPANGEENVDPDTTILVRFSQNMDSESVTNTSNYVVRGSISGEHDISASYDQETDDLIITSAGGGGGGGGEDVTPTASDPTGTGDTGSGDRGEEDPTTPIIDPDDPLGSITGQGSGQGEPETPSADPTPQPAGGGLTFTPGETVTVTLRSTLVSEIALPIDGKAFTFKIAGTPPSGFEPADNEFIVSSTTPRVGGEASSLSPIVEVRFETPITRTSAVFGPLVIAGFSFSAFGAQTVFANGSLTGDVTGTLTFLGGDGTATADAVRLSEMAFQPGETVTISLTRGIRAGTAQLRPYSLQFRIPGGRAQQQPSAAAGLNFPADDFDHVLDLQFADVSGINPGRELLLLEENQQLRILVQNSSGQWIPAGARDLSEEGSTVVALRVADTDRDGRLNPLVLFANGTVREYGITDTLQLQPVDYFAENITTGATDFEISDFDANGHLDAVIVDGAGYWVAAQLEEVRAIEGSADTETVRVFEIEQTLIEGGFDTVVAGDIDSDGRVDLLFTGQSGYRIFGNASDLHFQPIGTLAVQGLTVEPIIADYEGDGDNDVVTSDGVNLLVFVNEGNGVPEGGDWDGVSTKIVNSAGASPIERAIDALYIRNVDGDLAHLPDLVYYDKNANVLGFRSRTSTELHAFDNAATGADSTVPSTIESPRIAIDDFNGDTGLDLVLFGERPGLGPAIFTRSAQAVSEVSPADYAFSVPIATIVDLTSVDQEINLVVSGTFATEVASFTVALSHDAMLELVRVDRAPGTFPETTDLAIDDSQIGDGIIVATPSVSMAGQIDVPLLNFVFTLREPQPGNYAYELSQSLAAPNEVALADGTILNPTLSPASGQVIATSSVEPVTDLTCDTITVPIGGISVEQVRLTWTLPSEPFDISSGLEIQRNGTTAVLLGGGISSWVDPDPTVGGTTEVTYTVIGRRDGIFSPPTECSETVLPTPIITVCERSGGFLEFEWEADIAYDSYIVSIDGFEVAILTVTSFSFPLDDNGHVVSVVGNEGGELSSAASCTFIDEDAGVTAAPQNVVAGLSADRVNLSWINGEAYDTIVIRRIEGGSSVLLTDTLIGFVTAFEDPGPLAPGTYSYTVAGVAGGLESVAASSNEVVVEVLPPFGLTCTPDGPNVVLDWQNGSSLYSSLEVFRDGLSIALLPVDATSFTDSGLTDGSYTYFVRASIGADSADSASCGVTLENRIRVENLVTAVGATGAIELTADLLVDRTGFAFTIEYDASSFEFASVEVPGSVPSDVQVNGPDPVSGDIVSLEVIVDNVVVAAGDGTLLARVNGSAPADFAAVGVTPITLTSASAGGLDPTLVDGSLNVRGDAVTLSSHSVEPGEEFSALVSGTYDQDLGGVTIVVSFDPAVLTCEELLFSDTVIDTFGSSGIFINIDNDAGFVHGTVVGILTDPLTPVIDQLLAFVRFTADPGADGLVTTLGLDESHVFPDGGAGALETTLTTSSGQTISPYVTFGTVTVEGTPIPPSITSFDPTSGESVGGTVVTLTGDAFTADLTVEFDGVPAPLVTFVDPQTLIATTPPHADGPVAVTVTSATLGVVTAPQPFVYFTPAPPTLLDVTPTIALPCVPAEVTLTGTSFDPSMTVVFDTGADQFEVVPTFVSGDGTTATVMSPIVPDSVSGVTVRVVVGSFTSELTGVFAFTEEFIRGDVNSDGVVDTLDFDYLSAAFGGGPLPGIMDSADVNDDGFVLIDDLILLRSFVDGIVSTLPEPFPLAGPDPTDDGLLSACDAVP